MDLNKKREEWGDFHTWTVDKIGPHVKAFELICLQIYLFLLGKIFKRS